MIGEINSLHPVFRLAVDRILHDMRAKGWDPVIGSGMRSNEEQAALYAQGRSDLATVNRLRQRAGLGSISSSDNARTVTNAPPASSFHNAPQRPFSFDGTRIEMIT